MCDAIHYRVYAHMHWAYFWATVLWNLCQTSMQPDSKQIKWYLRPGTFNSTEGLPQRLQMGSVAGVKSQRLVGQLRAVLCLWATRMGSEVSGGFTTDLKRDATALSVSTAVSFHWHQQNCFSFGQECKRWFWSAVKGDCEILVLLLHSKNIFLWLSNTLWTFCMNLCKSALKLNPHSDIVEHRFHCMMKYCNCNKYERQTLPDHKTGF